MVREMVCLKEQKMRWGTAVSETITTMDLRQSLVGRDTMGMEWGDKKENISDTEDFSRSDHGGP